MPLALLLQEILQTFTHAIRRGGHQLNGWVRLVEIEALLVARAQGAFLIHWFGPQLPLQGFHVRVAIGNLDVLRARYLAVTSSTPQAAGGPNLTEPLAGFAGTLFGSLSSPVNSIFLYAQLARVMNRWWTVTLAVLNLYTFGLLGSFIAVAAGVGAAGALPGAFTAPNSAIVLNVYNLLGALAVMAAPFQRFWEVISGPRDEQHVRNPVLLGILRLADKLAVLFPFLIELFAFLITRLGPLIKPLSVQLPMFFNLVKAVGEIIKFMIDDMIASFKELANKDGFFMTTIKTVMQALKRFVRVLSNGLNNVMDIVLGPFNPVMNFQENLMGQWLTMIQPAIMASITEHPFVLAIVDLKNTISGLASSLRSTSTTPPPPPGFFGKLWDSFTSGIPPFPDAPSLPSVGRVTRQAGGPALPLSAIPVLRDVFQEIRRRIPGLLPNPLAISDAARRGLAGARHPGSVFSEDLRALERERDRAPAETLATSRLRDLLFEVVARVMPPVAYDAVRGLEDVFERLDREVGRQFPVRDPNQSDRLQPVVGRLRVRAQAGSETEVRLWIEQLRRALEAQTYVAPST